ncbi:GNAT family N-acetyltransferase [Pseudonocardia sp. EV170527-09]|nr:GNAT family N-acetyltransferase [Pseudonocardia sp. EV170527-09]
MTDRMNWPLAAAIDSRRLMLEPLRVDHADEAALLFDDTRLHEFIGGTPATIGQLRERYRRQVLGRSPDGSQGWLNWMVRERRTGRPVGTVQATLSLGRDGALEADLAWVVGVPFQGRGYAGEAAEAMAEWLASCCVGAMKARIHPDHAASAAIAQRLGMTRTDEVVDGEQCWAVS